MASLLEAFIISVAEGTAICLNLREFIIISNFAEEFIALCLT